VSAGGVIWFYYLSLFLVRLQQRIKSHILNTVINGLGVALCLIGIFFGFTAIKMFLK
jgi:hypothetical protein